MWRDQSDSRKQIESAMSSVVAILCSGIDFRTLALYSSSSKTGRTIAVSIQPGATQLTRIFGQSSLANAFVKEICRLLTRRNLKNSLRRAVRRLMKQYNCAVRLFFH